MKKPTGDRPIEVLHATECAATGTLTVLVSLVHELARAGVKQTILYSRHAGTPDALADLFPSQVKLVEVPRGSGLHFDFLREFSSALRRLVTTQKPDVVHLHSSKAGFAGRFVLAATPSETTVLYSPHGLSFLDPQRPFRNAVFRTLEYIASKTGARPIACGQGEAEQLAALSGREATVLENPVDGRFFAIQREQGEIPTIVSVGRLSRQKAPDRFALLARSLREQIPTIRCIWVGDGEAHYRSELLESGCEITGWIGSDEVTAYLALATVYVQTSQWEGLPVSVIQALAAGLPCVVNDCAGNRDAVKHGFTGFISRSNTEMVAYVVQLLGERGLREQMAIDARTEALRRFGPQAFRERVLQIYGISEVMPAPQTEFEGRVVS